MNGIVGLGPSQIMKSSLLVRLKQDAKIERTMISFDLGDDFLNEESYALFGGYDINKVKDKKLFTYPIKNDYYWAIGAEQVKYGDTVLGLNHINQNAA